MVGMGYYSDMGPVIEEESLNGYDADEEVFASCAVQKGDRVMIQSKISGKLRISCHTNKIYHLLPLVVVVTLVTPCYPCYLLLSFLPLVTPVALVTPCYLWYLLLPFLLLVTFGTCCYPCYPLLPL